MAPEATMQSLVDRLDGALCLGLGGIRVSAPSQISESFIQLDLKSVSPMQRLFAT
jgi:hypothetical protein